MTNQTPPKNLESETNLSPDLQRTEVGSVPGVGSMGVSTTGTAPLNPDALSDTARVALINSARELGQEHWCLSVPAQAKKVLNDCADALAQPVVNSVDYLATPRGHYDAWTDTGDGYTQRKGWTLTCLWCGAEFTGATKGEALKGYKAHEEKILQLLRVEDAERAKNRPEVKP